MKSCVSYLGSLPQSEGKVSSRPVDCGLLVPPSPPRPPPLLKNPPPPPPPPPPRPPLQ